MLRLYNLIEIRFAETVWIPSSVILVYAQLKIFRLGNILSLKIIVKEVFVMLVLSKIKD